MLWAKYKQNWKIVRDKLLSSRNERKNFLQKLKTKNYGESQSIPTFVSFKKHNNNKNKCMHIKCVITFQNRHINLYGVRCQNEFRLHISFTKHSRSIYIFIVWTWRKKTYADPQMELMKHFHLNVYQILLKTNQKMKKKECVRKSDGLFVEFIMNSFPIFPVRFV